MPARAEIRGGRAGEKAGRRKLNKLNRRLLTRSPLSIRTAARSRSRLLPDLADDIITGSADAAQLLP